MVVIGCGFAILLLLGILAVTVCTLGFVMNDSTTTMMIRASKAIEAGDNDSLELAFKLFLQEVTSDFGKFIQLLKMASAKFLN